MYDKFINIIKQTINKHAPMKIALQKQQNLLERPWMTWLLIVSTKVSINQNQKMYKTHFLSEGENLFSLYKTYANKLNRIKYFAKKTLVRCLINTNPIHKKLGNLLNLFFQMLTNLHPPLIKFESIKLKLLALPVLRITLTHNFGVLVRISQ